MESDYLVSIIIVNYNGKNYLKNCFDSLLQGTYKNIEIIIVDNGSADGSNEFVRDNYKNVFIVDNKDNLGLAVASNRGASCAKGKYLFFFNNDTIADKDLIGKLVRALELDPKIGIAGCATYTYKGDCLINQGVSCDIFGYPYGEREPFYVDAGIFISRDLFYKIGMFDEKMFLYGEDRDICWRCWLYGYKVKVVDDAKFFHDSACITKNLSEYRTNINRRFWSEFNAIRSILKNYSFIFICFILPFYIFVNILEICIFLVKRNFRVVKDIYLKSYKENIKDLRDTLNLRSKIQRERKISDLELIRHMDKVSGKVRLFFAAGIPEFNEQLKYGKG